MTFCTRMGHCSFIHGSNEERAAARGPEKHIHQEDKRQRHARGEKQGKQWLQPGFPKGGGRAHGRCKRSASNNTTRQAPAQSAQRRQMLGRWESQGCSRGEREPHHHGPLLLVQSPHTQLHYAVVRPLPLYLPSHSGGHHDHFCHPGSASCSAVLDLVFSCAPLFVVLVVLVGNLGIQYLEAVQLPSAVLRTDNSHCRHDFLASKYRGDSAKSWEGEGGKWANQAKRRKPQHRRGK
jgi:hypothetical protein